MTTKNKNKNKAGAAKTASAAASAPSFYEHSFSQDFARALAALDRRIAIVGQAQFEIDTENQLRDLQSKGYY